CTALVPRTGPFCGDHTTNGPETCDQGAANGATSCPYVGGSGVTSNSCSVCNASCSGTSTVTGPFCGDGHVANGEVSDQGATNGTQTCPYGQATCLVCKDDCSATEAGTGAFCGDSTTNAPFEQCDQGASNGVNTCPYQASPPNTCAVCTATCTNATATGPFCGDGLTHSPEEACDDGNATCGTCSANCKVVTPATQATGLIFAAKADDIVA